MNKLGIEIYPRHQYLLAADRATGTLVQLVENGRVLRWDITDAICSALTAVEDRRNEGRIRPQRKRAYLQMLYRGVNKLDIDTVKRAIREFPDAVAQVEEVLRVPDDMLKEAVTNILAASFWL